MNSETTEIEIVYHIDEDSGAVTLQCGTFKIDGRELDEICRARGLKKPSDWARAINELRRQYETN